MLPIQSLLTLSPIALTGENTLYAFGGSLVTLIIFSAAFAAFIVSQKEE